MAGDSKDEADVGDAPLTDHCYDGIQEYDNPLPGWWTWLFVATAVFSVAYWVVFHSFMPTRDLSQMYEVAVTQNLRLQFAELGELAPDREVILTYADDPKWLKVGKTTFAANCISCHGTRAEGLVGPNLTDDFWKGVKQPEDVARIVAAGAGGGAMPAWKTRLHPNEVVLVSSYIISLRGTLPEGTGRDPEGTRVEPWTTSGPIDGGLGDAATTQPDARRG